MMISFRTQQQLKLDDKSRFLSANVNNGTVVELHIPEQEWVLDRYHLDRSSIRKAIDFCRNAF